MPEWFPWKAVVQWVLRIPHLLNTDGWKAGNSLITGTYIQGAAYVWKAGNSVINGTYAPGTACEVWVTQISCDSCQNGVHGKPLLNGWKAGNSLINGTYIPGAAYGQKAGNSLINGTYIQGAACELRFMPEWFPWKAAVERVLRIPHLLNTDVWKAGNSVINGTYTPGAAYVWKAGNSLINGTYIPGAAYVQKAGNSLINGTYIQGAACEIWDTQISSDSCQNGVHGKLLLSGLQDLGHSNQLQFMPDWCPCKATVEQVPRIPHPLNTDGRKAGNSLINGTYIPDGRKAGNSLITGTYIQGAACEVWVTQISSDSCPNGVHGKLLFSGCWGYHIRSIQMSEWLAIVSLMPNTPRVQLVRSGSLKSAPIHARMVSMESHC
ncbi:hypothetical protein BKA82DRAFT_4017399 [Pisolithus tinctorius]|nr:hypothetical protein BKA82DRAFT_4017399 [Pisolithus tinctorius]